MEYHRTALEYEWDINNENLTIYNVAYLQQMGTMDVFDFRQTSDQRLKLRSPNNLAVML